jgi:tetratricopeptide (TPR) repeat protein
MVKVLLVGWEETDWVLLAPLIEADQLPAVASLLERGVVADLRSLDNPVPALLWTSMATGRSPVEHGVLDHWALDPVSGELRPAGLVDAEVPSLWRLLSAAGMSCHVVNWFASHPAQPISGVSVSDRFGELSLAGSAADWPVPHGSVCPVERLADLERLRCHPSLFSAADLAPYIRDLESINLDDDRRPIEIASLLATTSSVNAAARYLLANEPWHFLAVRFHGIAAVCHRLLRAHVSDEGDHHHYSGLLSSILRVHDRMLAGLIELAGPDTTVLLVSEQGVVTPSKPWRRQSGLLAMAGPTIRADQLIHGAHLLDVVPTLMRLFGIAAPAAMTGSVLHQVFVDSRPIGSLMPAPSLEMANSTDPLEDQEAVAQVLALGFPLFSSHELRLQEAHRHRRDVNRVLVQIEAGDWAAAAPLLRQLAAESDALPGFSLLEAYAHLCCGDLQEASRSTADARQRLGSSVLVLVLEALIAMGRQQLIEALHRLEEAEQLGETDPFAQGRLGLAWLELGRLDRAEQHIRASLAQQPADAILRLSLAAVLIDRQCPAEGLLEAQRVVSQLHHNPVCHAVLGQAQLACGQPQAARASLNRALDLHPSRVQRARIVQFIASIKDTKHGREA